MQRGGNPRSARSDMPLSDQIYQRLKWSLIVGEHGPDSALSIRTVAERMGTSMMPVREALKRLASERALIASANRSFRVPRLDPSRVSDLFFLRANLEGAATELATPRMTLAEIDQLEKLARRTNKDIESGVRGDYLANNYAFHFTIYAGAGNPELTSIIEGLWAQSGPYLADVVRVLETTEDWRLLHARIAEAIGARNARLARDLVEQDIGWSMDVYDQLADSGDTVNQTIPSTHLRC